MRGLVTSIIGLFALFIDRGVSFSPSSSAVHNVHYAPIIASIGRTTTTTTTNLKSSNNMIGDVEIEALMGSTMEQARLTNQYARFGHSDWLNHRSSDRFYRALLEFDKSPVVKNLLDEALVLASICVFIIVYNGLFTVGFTDFNEIHHDPIFANSVPNWIAVKLCLPTDPFFLCSGPLGLLLVFRNDVCFGRYKEAFSYWESAMSSLTNMLLMTSNASTNVEAVRNLGIASWVVARTTQHEVLGGFDPKEKYEAEIRKVVTDTVQADNVLMARDKLYRAKYDVHLAVDVFSDEISNLDKRTIINNFNQVASACTECERLYSTPIPLLYTRWTLKFLTFWITFMPFAFYNVFENSWNHIMMIPAQIVIAFLFFGIEEIAVSLEEPFSILPLDELVEEFYLNIEDTTNWMEERQQLS